ncbi:RNA polymerase sigma factor [uncultured Mycobacterium sp.]|uniref:RNA polymerase sigma factor n=1 Tax=uncultured Mycobacterium sp. TaxID=171292 RepID=A0A1Y5PEE5_9MYCO|nr:RNA polymerase sigma factor [uncultured Mycobacterium sp.]
MSNGIEGSDASKASAAEQNSCSSFERDILPFTADLYRRAVGYTKNATDAEDLVQETLLKAYNAFDRLREDTYLRAWLLRIMRNTWISDYRARLRRPAESLVGEVDEGSERAQSAENQVFRQLLDPDVREALFSLSTEMRETLYWVAIEGMSYREAADIMGVPEGTVMSRMHRSRASMRRSLGDAA